MTDFGKATAKIQRKKEKKKVKSREKKITLSSTVSQKGKWESEKQRSENGGRLRPIVHAPLLHRRGVDVISWKKQPEFPKEEA